MTAPVPPSTALAAALADALARHRAGDFAGAERGYRAILDSHPGQPDALHLLGVLAHQCGHHGEAARLIGEALTRRDGIADYHANLGLALHAQGRATEAEAAYRRALALREAYPEAHNSLGSALQERGRLDEAIVHYRRALDLRDGYAEAWTNLGTALHAADRHAGAEEALRRALRLDSGDAVAWTNLGVVLKEAGRLAEAEAAHAEALRLAPGDPETLVNMALLRSAQGHLAEAEALYLQAVAVDPAFPLARWNLALLRLGQGRLPEGQALYEARFASRRVQGGRDDLTLPRWDGSDPVTSRILVWREQGLGDELLFGSVLPDLVARAGHVTVECDARLVGLLARSLPGATVRAPTQAPTDADAQIAMGSLPGVLRRRLADFPTAAGWLRPDPARAAPWRDRLAALGPGLRVGICWRSQHRAGERKHAYTALKDWAPLFAVPGLTLVSLQYDDAGTEIAEAEARFGVRLHRWADTDLKHDLEAAAALTAALDLVVTVATSVGEMAGALGVPVWRFGGPGDWTALGTAVRPWFPAMRLWSARPGEDLAGVLGRIAGELRRLTPPVPALAPSPVPGLLAEARRLHDGGQWPEAEKIYQRILDLDVENAEALEGYGWLGQQAGRPDIAVTLLTRALAAEATAGRHKRRALAHQILGDLAAAEADWRAAAALAPGDVEVLGSLGGLLLGRGDAEGSALATTEALRHAPAHAGLHANLGLALQAAGRDGGRGLRRALALDPALAEGWNGLAALGVPETAERDARRALILRPGYPEALGNHGVALLALDRTGEAVASLRAALRARAEDGGTLANLALALERSGDGNAAGLVWWRTILLSPGVGTGWAGLADLRQRQGRLDAAMKAWSRALAVAPGRADWRYNAGNALHAAGRMAEADAAYRLAVETDPSLTLAAFNRGYAALARGDLEAGWAGLEARFASGQAVPDRRFRIPAWDGGDLAGRTVLVWREQGVGDELMHSSCYADLIARAGRVIVECEPRLVALFARSFPTALVRAATADPVDADCHVAAGSLPLRLRGRLADFPARKGWLRADAGAVEAWRRVVAAPFSSPQDDPPLPGGERGQGAGGGNVHPLTIGLCWRSRFRTAGRSANYTTLDRWGPILTLPGLRFVNLQYDDCEAELAEAESRFGIAILRPGLDLLDDLDGAAALTAALDLVISAGTSVAEMAGALGVPVWRIGHAGEWTALGTGCRPWFPSMRLFSPPPGGTLDDALSAAGRALAHITRPERPRP
ncbi:tetratricopeptide repeat protein [Azospirillum doebereinerae]|uniref:tetratricopeptide repeat protein n=1 Tax=Azospirillum doebereinerae TaxID=92933 RepID=UPI001EE60213|nr:tetratricopeptide repeat protein [Azospirillum doebereinerae]MCG5242354.1 tetratricopeptide repeat protein [Azospirillum doebereinerae]